MKKMKNPLASLTVFVLAVGLALNFNACTEQSPLQSTNISDNDTMLLSKKANFFPKFASRTFHYYPSVGFYNGGNISGNASTFHMVADALTPPPGTPFGEDVTITMLIEKADINNELVFTFGPSGCTFDPPAAVWLDWKDLHSENATLYYIDSDGNYIPLSPNYVDSQGRRMKLFIDHFSRYAIGTE